MATQRVHTSFPVQRGIDIESSMVKSRFDTMQGRQISLFDQLKSLNPGSAEVIESLQKEVMELQCALFDHYQEMVEKVHILEESLGRSTEANIIALRALTGEEKVVPFSLGAKRKKLDEYFEYRANYPVLEAHGDLKKREISLITDRDEIEALEAKDGMEMGIIGENPWYTFTNNRVRFCDGKAGMYTQIFSRATLTGNPGVVILPQMESDGRLVMVSTYRFSADCWSLEFPRGSGEPGDIVNRTIKKELGEETGAVDIPEKRVLLGRVNGDTGCLLTTVPIWKVAVKEFKQPDRESAEKGMTVHLFTRVELREVFQTAARDGHISMKLHGEMRKVLLIDGFTFAALQWEQMLGLDKA